MGAIRMVSGTVSVLSTDETLVCDTSSGQVTLNLPAGVDGQIYRFTDGGLMADTNNIIVNANGSEEFLGIGATLTLASPGVYLQVQFLGTKWYLIG